MNRIRCLIADDHETLRRGLVDLLSLEEDLEVIGQAGSAAQVLALAERRQPDVIVADVRLPDQSGIELCREQRRRGITAATVLYTAFEDPKLVEDGLAAGANGFVLKSGPPQSLIQAVRLAARGERYIDAAVAPALLTMRERPERTLLSARESEVLALLSLGRTTEQAATELFLSPTTVRSYAEAAMAKLGAGNRVHAVAQALRLGIIE